MGRLLRLLERGDGLLRVLRAVDVGVGLQPEEGAEVGCRLRGVSEVGVRDAAVEGERGGELSAEGLVSRFRGFGFEDVERSGERQPRSRP
jgi:hypothetical protein